MSVMICKSIMPKLRISRSKSKNGSTSILKTKLTQNTSRNTVHWFLILKTRKIKLCLGEFDWEFCGLIFCCRKIVEKAISAKELVRLSPDEMASQELAQWREKENQHQLEIIKKSELELMTQGQTFIIKSRKGEEVCDLIFFYWNQ